jgi:probable phosphoglycerate mutase
LTTTIVLIRHGETAWNAQRRLQGHIDIGLNAEGERQADALAQSLAGERFDAVYASDLARASQTAASVANLHDLPVHTEPGLRERCYGIFEGLLYSEIEASYPGEFAAWQSRDVDAVMPAGERAAESFRQFYARTIDTLASVAERHDGQHIAIVAHGGVLECAYRAALGLPLGSPRDFAVLNASINRLTYADGKLALTTWGDVAHLTPATLDDL